jgi:arabinose-5-phosphate isomerase
MRPKPKIPSARILSLAREVLQIEAEGILRLVDRIGEDFAALVDMICQARGRVIIGGIGKSGIIARKIVATLNSTGTRSIFLHPVEAMHGDLGMVSPDDIFLALSNSGETDELNLLLPRIRSIGCKVVAFTGKTDSTLARHSDRAIDVGVAREACPLGLAPTASTTAMLAMGDALAVVLITQKQFKASDFKRIHPGGLLGQRLSRKVRDIMLDGDSIPMVADTAPMAQVLAEIERLQMGVVFVVDNRRHLVGIITDGDLRRALARGLPLQQMHADQIMTHGPRTITADAPAYDALNLMEQHQITVLAIIDGDTRVEGILHLHDILGKGAFKFNGT